MKKMFIVMFAVAMAVAACGGNKQAPAAPAAGSAEGSAAPAEGSTAPAEGEGAAAPAEGATPAPQ